MVVVVVVVGSSLAFVREAEEVPAMAVLGSEEAEAISSASGRGAGEGYDRIGHGHPRRPKRNGLGSEEAEVISSASVREAEEVPAMAVLGSEEAEAICLVFGRGEGADSNSMLLVDRTFLSTRF